MPTLRSRPAACGLMWLLAEIYTETGYPMPTAVIDRLFELMETDPLPPVRFAAARALCDHGLVSERKV